jgi:hypothetical protein
MDSGFSQWTLSSTSSESSRMGKRFHREVVLIFWAGIWKPTHYDGVSLHQGEETVEKIGGDTPVAGESMLQVNQVFTLEQIARTASMHTRVTSAAEKHKRVYIAVPSLWAISQ